MKHRPFILCMLLLAVVSTAPGAWCDPTGGTDVLAIVNAVIHPASGPAIVGGTLVARGSRIVSVGQGPPPSGATVIDAHGQHLYPSLIDPDTALGLVEIQAVRATRDERERGRINANARADIAFNADSLLLPVTASAGVLVAGVAPSGSLISGRSAVMMLHGWTREDMTVKAPAALYVKWPRMEIERMPWSPKAKKQEKERREALRELDDVFDNARAYMRARTASKAEEQDVQWDAIASTLRGDIPVFIDANDLDAIRAALEWTDRQKIHMVLVGGRDAWRVAKSLARRSVGVIYNNLLNTPSRAYEAYDTNYRAPAVLSSAGVAVALSVGGDAGNVRWLPDLAGRARAYGLGDLESLQAITLRPAEMLGVADRLGTLSAGKDATFFLADGDIMDTRTHVLRAWVQGSEIDLTDRQKQLWNKYRNRPKN